MYYFDNAATTAQKPEAVAHAVYNVLSSGTVGNPSRGAHGYALKAYGIVLQAKDDVKALFHCGPEYDVAFTHNSTAALNMVLKGLIHPGDGVLTTSWNTMPSCGRFTSWKPKAYPWLSSPAIVPAAPCSMTPWKNG